MNVPAPDASRSLKWMRLIVVAAAVLIFLPTVGFDFSGWDDPIVLAENPRLLKPTAANLGFYWSNAEYHLYVPVTQTAWWLIAHVARYTDSAGDR